MTKHIYTFGELEKENHIFLYRMNDGKVETLTVDKFYTDQNKITIYVKERDTLNVDSFCIDMDRIYVTGLDEYKLPYVLMSDYDVKEMVDTVISITKRIMK